MTDVDGPGVKFTIEPRVDMFASPGALGVITSPILLKNRQSVNTSLTNLIVFAQSNYLETQVAFCRGTSICDCVMATGGPSFHLLFLFRLLLVSTEPNIKAGGKGIKELVGFSISCVPEIKPTGAIGKRQVHKDKIVTETHWKNSKERLRYL